MIDDVYGLPADVEWLDADPAEWRGMPTPEGDDAEDDEDDPAPAYVESILGLDPDALFDDGNDDGWSAVGNAFCPGEGARDNSCSSSEGGTTTALGGSGMAATPPNEVGVSAAAKDRIVREAGGPVADRLMKAAISFGGKMVAAGGHLEHVVKDYVADGVASAVEKLPNKLQTVINGVFAAGRVGLGVAFASFTAGQALAERVAKERGATHEEAKRLRGILASADIAAAKPALIFGGLAGSFVPAASAGYLAYSTARDPLATVRAAYKATMNAARRTGLKVLKLGRAAGRLEDALDGLGATPTRREAKPTLTEITRNASPRRIEKLADALEEHGWDDWYSALLSTSLDAAAGDLDVALDLADAAYEDVGADPRQPSAPDDAEYLFSGLLAKIDGGPTANSDTGWRPLRVRYER